MMTSAGRFRGILDRRVSTAAAAAVRCNNKNNNVFLLRRCGGGASSRAKNVHGNDGDNNHSKEYYYTTTRNIWKRGYCAAAAAANRGNNGNSNKTDSGPLPPPPDVQEAWPHLEQRFHALLDSEGQFPLLPMSQQQQLVEMGERQQQQQQREAADAATGAQDSASTTTAAAGGGASGSSSSVDDSRQQKQQAKDGNDKAAAVLVLLVSVGNVPCLLFTRRSAHLSQHAAEISFPGGHYEADVDTNFPVDTAVREAVEELFGAPPSSSSSSCLSSSPRQGEEEEDAEDVVWKQQQQQQQQQKQQLVQSFRGDIEILGCATPLPSIRGVPVTPVLGAIRHRQFQWPITDAFPGDASEVDLVFAVPIQELLAVEGTHVLPATRFNRTHRSAPIFPVPQGKIWGLTAYMLKPILHQLLKPVFFPHMS
jgi:hypothetical protein